MPPVDSDFPVRSRGQPVPIGLIEHKLCRHRMGMIRGGPSKAAAAVTRPGGEPPRCCGRVPYGRVRPVTGAYSTGPSRRALCVTPAMTAPTIGASQNSQSC